MSLESKLESVMRRMKQNAEKLDETTKNIANATTRVTYELAKSQTFRDKYDVPLEKYEQIIDFTQKMVDICSNYVPPKAMNGDGTDHEAGNAGADALQFERFEAQALGQLEKNETEIVKLQSLRDVIDQISLN